MFFSSRSWSEITNSNLRLFFASFFFVLSNPFFFFFIFFFFFGPFFHECLFVKLYV